MRVINKPQQTGNIWDTDIDMMGRRVYLEVSHDAKDDKLAMQRLRDMVNSYTAMLRPPTVAQLADAAERRATDKVVADKPTHPGDPWVDGRLVSLGVAALLVSFAALALSIVGICVEVCR